MTAANELTPQPQRRRFTFSLRTLLILMVLASLALAFVAHPLYQWRQQDLLVKEIHKRNPGFKIGYGNGSRASAWVEVFTIQFPNELWILNERKLPMLSGLRHLDLREPKIENKDLANLRGCTALRGLGLSSKQFDDRAIEHFKLLPSLEQISFWRCPVTDRGAEEIAKLRNLKSVTLNDTRITDEGFASLAQLPNLGWLNLRNSQVSDSTIQLFTKKPKITNLYLDHSKVTGNFGLSKESWPKLIQFSANSTPFDDRGLSQLVQCKSVSHLHLIDTKITDSTIPLLHELPNLQYIEISSEHITIDGLRKLLGHPGLWHLKVDGGFSDGEIESLRKSLSLGRTNISVRRWP